MSILNDSKIATREFVLCALYNGSRPIGLGFLQARFGPLVMSDAEAAKILDEYKRPNGDVRFDYLFGRPLKTDFPAGGVPTEFRLFERDNGPVERALQAELERRTTAPVVKAPAHV